MRYMNILHLREQFWGFCYSGILWAILAYTIDVYIWLPLLSETIMLLKEKEEKVEKNHKFKFWPGPCQHQFCFFCYCIIQKKQRTTKCTTICMKFFFLFFFSGSQIDQRGKNPPDTTPKCHIQKKYLGNDYIILLQQSEWKEVKFLW